MKKKMVTVGGAIAFAAAAAFVIPHFASADDGDYGVDRIPDAQCRTAAGFVEVYSAQAPNQILCFANGGHRHVDIFQVSGGVSGNNHVVIHFADGSTVERDGWADWSSPAGQDHVVQIDISANTNNPHPVG